MTRNIIEIHTSILKTFEDEEKEIPILSSRLELLKKLNDISIQSQIEHIESRLDSVKNRNNFYFYILKAVPLLEEYRMEINRPIEINFMGAVKKRDNSKLDNIINQYENIVKNYIQIVPEVDPVQESICPTCKQKNSSIINSDNICTCSYCGTEQDEFLSTFSYRDVERINISSKYQYDRRVHFKECINQFQGKQNSTIKPDVYEKLEEQLRIHGLVNDSPIREEKYKRVTKKHIGLLLKEIGYASHYEDLNLIYRNITGQQLDDISSLEAVLIEDFDKLSKLYDEEYIKTRKLSRKNFINTQYVLFQLLRRHRYPCNQTDFSFLKTIERKMFHDIICSHLFEKLGWNFQPIF